MVPQMASTYRTRENDRRSSISKLVVHVCKLSKDCLCEAGNESVFMVLIWGSNYEKIINNMLVLDILATL